MRVTGANREDMSSTDDRNAFFHVSNCSSVVRNVGAVMLIAAIALPVLSTTVAAIAFIPKKCSSFSIAIPVAVIVFSSSSNIVLLVMVLEVNSAKG